MDRRMQGLEKKRLTLYLAASDMDQAAAAAAALDKESENVNLMRALETAIAVCYARPFTEGSLVDRLKASKWVERGDDRKLHDFLMNWRDKVYAHTDVASGRSAAGTTVALSNGTVTASYSEGWWAFPRECIAPLIIMCEKQVQSLRAEALRIEAQIEAAQAAGSETTEM